MVEVIWQKDRIAAAHGRFNGIRQVAPVCIPPNNASLGPPESTTQTATNPNGISIGSAVFAQFTAECPYTL